MRIAFVVHDFNRTWGHSRYTFELATRFSATHEVHVFSNTVDAEGTEGIQFHHVPALRLNALTTILSFAVTGTLATLRPRFDILHSQGLCGMLANVVTAHQCNRAWHAARRFTENRIAWRERVFGALVSRLEQIFYSLMAGSPILAISHLVEEDLRREYGCAIPMPVIHHGVDAERFRPASAEIRREVRQRFRIGPAEPVFLFAGDLRKGAHQAIRALARLERGILLLVSRSQPGDYQNTAVKYGVENRTVFAGASERIEEFYGAADYFLLPTPYDPFALVATEAMSCGLPSIVSRRAGASELIRHGENGFILQDPSDVGELSRHMQELLDDPALAARMGAAARTSMAHRTWDQVAARTMLVYEQQYRRRQAPRKVCESESSSS